MYLMDAGGVAAGGSPFRKWFVAGRVEPRRSRVGRAHHALVWCAGHARQLHIHPRDQFDNPAPLAAEAPDGFSALLSPLGAEPDTALSQSAAFHYDAVNQRVSMALCFPRAGIYRASVFYDKVLLHNGQFDCIVLTGGYLGAPPPPRCPSSRPPSRSQRHGDGAAQHQRQGLRELRGAPAGPGQAAPGAVLRGRQALDAQGLPAQVHPQTDHLLPPLPLHEGNVI